MATPTAVGYGASWLEYVEIATVGAVVYALPVVVNPIEPGSMEDPAIPIVALALLVPGCPIVTIGTLV